MTSTSPQKHSLNRFFRNPQTGELTVAQPPNLPLWVWLVATAIRLVVQPHGAAATALSVVSTGSLAVWAVLEIARGDSPFRRVLGGVVAVAIAFGLLMRLLG